MSIRLGTTNPSSFRLGTTAVSKLMLGVTEVWSAVDADAANYFARIATAGSSISSANQAAVNAFIVGCKSDGIWSAIKASCLLCAAESLAGALVPLVGTAPTNVGGLFVSGDYSRTTGLNGNGSSKYLNSNRNNTADPQNSKHVAVWVSVRNSTTGTYIGVLPSVSGGTGLSEGGNARLHNLTAALSTINPINFFGASRSASENFTARASGGNYTIGQTSQTPYNQSINVFTSGSGVFSQSRLAFYSIGEALNLALLDARLTTLMSALT